MSRFEQFTMFFQMMAAQVTGADPKAGANALADCFDPNINSMINLNTGETPIQMAGAYFDYIFEDGAKPHWFQPS